MVPFVSTNPTLRWHRTGPLNKSATLLAMLAAAVMALPGNARAQTRVYDLPKGGKTGTYWRVGVLTTPRGSRTYLSPNPCFYPRDPWITPVYVIDEVRRIYI